jgi:hypothetical protein
VRVRGVVDRLVEVNVIYIELLSLNDDDLDEMQVLFLAHAVN